MGRERWRCSVEELLAELRETESRMRRDYAVTLELVAELETRGAAVECGYRGVSELLKDVLRISRGQARRRVRHARAVTEVELINGDVLPPPLPFMGMALRAGELGADHLDIVSTALSALPPHVSAEQRNAAEVHLVDAARRTDPRTLATFAVQLRTYLDQDGAPPTDDELAHPVNELHLTTKRTGRLAFSGELEPEAGALFTALISPLAKPRPRTDTGPTRAPPPNVGVDTVDSVAVVASRAGPLLLCGQHHRLVHHSDWECEIRDGTPMFRPPRYVDPERLPRVNLRFGTVPAA